MTFFLLSTQMFQTQCLDDEMNYFDIRLVNLLEDIMDGSRILIFMDTKNSTSLQRFSGKFFHIE